MHGRQEDGALQRVLIPEEWDLREQRRLVGCKLQLVEGVIVTAGPALRAEQLELLEIASVGTTGIGKGFKIASGTSSRLTSAIDTVQLAPLSWPLQCVCSTVILCN